MDALRAIERGSESRMSSTEANAEDLAKQPAYPRRITNFIDMLGFNRDVRSLERRPHLLLPIEAVLRHIATANAISTEQERKAQDNTMHG